MSKLASTVQVWLDVSVWICRCEAAEKQTVVTVSSGAASQTVNNEQLLWDQPQLLYWDESLHCVLKSNSSNKKYMSQSLLNPFIIHCYTDKTCPHYIVDSGLDALIVNSLRLFKITKLEFYFGGDFSFIWLQSHSWDQITTYLSLEKTTVLLRHAAINCPKDTVSIYIWRHGRWKYSFWVQLRRSSHVFTMSQCCVLCCLKRSESKKTIQLFCTAFLVTRKRKWFQLISLFFLN